MVGQKNLIGLIDTLIKNDRFPLFSIILGQEGSGKHTLVKYIADELKYNLIFIDSSADDVRSFIESAINQTGRNIYVIQDISSASVTSKNALLKIVETPPQNSRIVLLANNKDGILETLLSRATLFKMQEYTEKDLKDYCSIVNAPYNESYGKLCVNIGELKYCLENDLSNFIKLSDKVINNISKSTYSSVLMLWDKINLTDEDSTTRLTIFMNALERSLVKYALANKDIASTNKGVKVVELLKNFRNSINNKSMNKKYLFDKFVLLMWGIFNGDMGT